MSDKSSDIEDWAFVDKDGEIESSDEGSSSSSIEVVNVENDVVTYQNRRSLERSVSPTENGNCSASEEGLAVEMSLPSSNLEHQENIVTKDSVDGNTDADIGVQEKVDVSKQELSTMNRSTDDQPQRELSVASDTSNVPSIQSLSSDLADNSSDADSDYIRLESESVDGDNLVMTSSSVSSNFNFISRENSPLSKDGDEDKLTGLERGSNEELVESNNSPPDESINQEFHESINKEPDGNSIQDTDFNGNEESDDDNQNSAENDDHLVDLIQNLEDENHNPADIEDENHNPADIEDRQENGIINVVVDNQVLEANNPNPVEIDDRLEDNNHNPRDNHHVNDDLSDVDQNDESAEVEEDQDRHTDSGTEDDRIESDQSDAGSIPPLDDDMSFVNDIGDLPLVAGDVARQYVHNPNRHVNLILDVIAILIIAVVVGLGIGHAIATFDEIEEYETLHSSIANLRSQALSCQNQKWSQKVTINELRVEQESLNMKYKESQAEQENLRVKNTLLLMELKEFRKLETSNDGVYETKLILQNEINQLKTENEELKQVIGRLKYTTHPANKNIGNTDANINNELCDKSASDTKAALKYHGKRLSDCSLLDLQDIHNSESLDNSLLKQEVGRLRYTSHPGNQVPPEKSSEDEVYVDIQHQKIIEDFQCENVTALKEELNRARHNAEIWFQKYFDLKEQNQLNSTNCLKYIMSNLNTTQLFSSVNTTVLKSWLTSSAAAAKDVQDVVSEMGSKVWDDVSKTSQEILQTITDEFQMVDDPDYDTDLNDDPDYDTDLNDDKTDDDDDDLAYDDTILDLGHGDDVKDLEDDVKDLKDDDNKDQDVDNNDQDVDNKGPRNEDHEEIDSESSNDTDENTKHHAKWSDNVKDILNKTRHKMSNVSQQIKDTWLQVKNLSHQFWNQHEGKVTKTLTKFTNKVVNIGRRIKDKLHRKIFKKDKGKPRNQHKQQKNDKFSEGKMKRDKSEKYQKDNQHDRKWSKKSKWNKKQLKQQAKQDRRLRKQANLQKKTQEKLEKKLGKTIGKYQYRMSNKMNNEVFEKLNEKAKQSEFNKIYHMKRYVADLGFSLDTHQHNSKVKIYLESLNCQDLWWSSVVVKDMPTDTQILQCSQFLADWQLKKLLTRRKSMLIEGKLQISDKWTEKEIDKIQKKFGIYENTKQVKEDDSVTKFGNTADESADWQFQRAVDREEVRQRESEPNWLFERANQRKESRKEKSEPDWLFDRAKHRKDLRFKEWKEPEWTFKRSKYRAEVREEEHRPDWVFDRAQDREQLRDESSSSSRRQRHEARVYSCEDF